MLAKTNEVRNRAEGSLTWYPTGEGDVLHTEDTLLTGPDGSARVRLEPEGEVFLGPNSMIRFSQTRQAGDLPVLSLEVRRGAARVASKSRAVALQVQSRSLSVEADSQVQVAASELAEQARVEVKSGSLRETSGEESLSAGEAMEIQSDGEVKAVALPLKVSDFTPAEGAVFTGDSKVSFNWEGDEASVEIGREKNFTNAKLYPQAQAKAGVALGPGIYFWRVREGERTGPAASFILRPEMKLQATLPKPQATIKGGEGIELRWKGGEVAAGFFVQLSQDPGFKAILYEKRVGTSSLKLPKLKRGDYFWRVQAEHPQFGSWPFSEGFAFSVKDRLAPPKTKGVKVLKKKSRLELWDRFKAWMAKAEEFFLPSAYAGEPSLRLYFEWKEVEGAKEYQFELSRSPRFESIEKKERTKETQVSVEVSVNAIYYWRVRGVDDEGGLGAPSQPQKIRPRRLLEIYQASGGDEDSEEGIKLDKTPNFYSVAIGPSGGYHFQNIVGTSGTTENRGFPLNRGEFKLMAGSLTRPWEARLWYHYRRYTSGNSELSGTQGDLNHGLFGGQILWHTPWRIALPIRLGIHAEYLPILRRTSVTSAQLERRFYGALIFGGTVARLLGERWRLVGDFFLEGSPVGELRGIGGIIRGRVSHSGLSLSALGMIAGPEVEVGFYPSYRWASPDNRSVFTMDFSATLYLTIQFLG